MALGRFFKSILANWPDQVFKNPRKGNDPLPYHQIINICDMAEKFVQSRGSTNFGNIPLIMSVSAQRPVPQIAEDEDQNCHGAEPDKPGTAQVGAPHKAQKCTWATLF